MGVGLSSWHGHANGQAQSRIAPESAGVVVAAMRACCEGARAVRIGTAYAEHPGRVTMRTLVGAHRIVDMLVGEQLPRIC